MFGKILDKITYIYLILPVCIFLINWLNPVVAAIALIALIIILRNIFKGLLKRDFEINKYQIFCISFIALLWCILAGIGGFYYQSPDWHWRNAIFRDLINFSHPVIYDNGAALVYYFGFFLPGAVVGKLALFLHSSPELAFKIGNFFNLIYSTIGIVLVFLQILLLTNAKKKQFFTIIFLFIFFSGLDVLFGSGNNYKALHIEWHFNYFQFSSNTTLLFWVYNQTIAPWLITSLFLRRPFNISNYGFLGSIGLFFAPLPFAGLSIYLASMTIVRFVRQAIKKHLKSFFSDLFNIKNILSILFLFPIFYLFYSSNIAASEDVIYIFAVPIAIMIFLLFEVGIYVFVIWRKNFKNTIFYATTFTFMFVPFFLIGNNADFCMRASIPALFTLFILIIKYLFDNKRLLFGKCILIIALILGMVTPSLEFLRGFLLNNVFIVESRIKDDIITFNNKININCQRTYSTTNYSFIPTTGNYKNYGAVDLDKKIFFKYLAKKPRK